MQKLVLYIFLIFMLCSANPISIGNVKISSEPTGFPAQKFSPMKRYTCGEVPSFPRSGIYLLTGEITLPQWNEKHIPSLFIPPMPFPCVIVLNGEEIYHWGYLEQSTCMANFSAVSVPLYNYHKGINHLNIYFFSDGQSIALPTFFVENRKNVEKRVFLQSLLNHQLVQAIAIMALFSCIIFLGHAASTGFKEHDVLSFAILAFAIFLGYTPFVFNNPLSDDLVWFKISRFGYVLASYFLFQFCSSFTLLLTGKPWKVGTALAGLPFLLLLILAQSKAAINTIFGISSLIFILPILTLNVPMLIFSTIRKKYFSVKIITLGYLLFYLGVMTDLFFVLTMKEPFFWMTPYSYFILICAIVFALYIRQNTLYHDLLMYKSELVYTNQSLLTAHTRLVTESTAKELFISAISHEFRTPLNGMVGIIDSFVHEAECNIPDSMKPTALYLASSFHRFELIVQNLIDYQELQLGKLILKSHSFSPEELLQTLIGYCGDDAKIKSISLIPFYYNRNLPKLLVGDSTRIAVILNNLIRNAIKFTTVGGVSVKAEYNNSLLCVTIADTGCGIDNALQEQIFQAFTRGEEIAFTQRYEGIGLGLAIVDALTKSMNGTLDLFSEKGKGTRFVLRLPLVIPVELGVKRADVRVLVADDNVVNRTVIKHQLEKNGYHVTSVENGEEAVSQVVKFPFDIVLMDIQMPVMDGYEASMLIREQCEYLPIIGVTANADRNKCIASGMNDVMFKPTTAEGLQAVILEYLQ